MPNKYQACSRLYEVNAISFLRHRIRTVDNAPHSWVMPHESLRRSPSTRIYFIKSKTLCHQVFEHTRKISINKNQTKQKPQPHTCAYDRGLFASRVGDFAPWRRIWTQPRMRAHSLLGADSRFCDDFGRLRER